MALDILAERANVKRSLESYFHGIFGPSGKDFYVDYEGVPFETKEKREWLQPRVMDFSGEFLRQGSATQYATNVNMMFNVNILVTKSGTTIADRHYVLRDKVVEHFKIGQTINIRNWTSGTTPLAILGKMKVRQLITDRPIEDEHFLQYSLTWELDWLDLTTNP